MMLAYIYNKKRFSKEVKLAGSPGKLTNTQLAVQERYVSNCNSVYKREQQDIIIKGMLTCKLDQSRTIKKIAK
jgi:hypothetical protein